MSIPVIVHGPPAVINRFSSNKPNSQVPFLQGVPNSMVSPEWYRFLTNVDQAVYGTSGTTTVNNITTFPDLQITEEMNDAVEQNETALEALDTAQDGISLAWSVAESEGVVGDITNAQLATEYDDTAQSKDCLDSISWYGDISDVVGTAQPESNIIAGSSPFSYVAPFDGSLLIQGGTTSAVVITRNSSHLTGIIAGFIPVSRGDTVTVTYTVAPNLVFFPR